MCGDKCERGAHGGRVGALIGPAAESWWAGGAVVEDHVVDVVGLVGRLWRGAGTGVLGGMGIRGAMMVEGCRQR